MWKLHGHTKGRVVSILGFNVTCDWPTTAVIASSCIQSVVVMLSMVHLTKLAVCQDATKTYESMEVKKVLNDVLYWYLYHFRGISISTGIVIF